MSVQWIQLDTDFLSDPKIKALRRLHGYEGVGVWWSFVACIRRECCGYLDLNDPISRAFLEEELGFDTEALDAWIERFVACRLLDKGFHEEGRATSERLLKDAERYRRSKDAKAAGGRKSGAVRRAKKTLGGD
jgi:hypothetical protein